MQYESKLVNTPVLNLQKSQVSVPKIIKKV